MAEQQKITTCLWFDRNAEEAAKHYTSIFKDSKILSTTHYGEPLHPQHPPKGTVMTVEFEIEGRRFLALNGGPQFKFNESISLIVNCDTQQELDHMWSKLSAGGEEGPCGWLKDKFGLSWQVVPTALKKMVTDADPKKSQRVMAALMQMGKLDIARLEQAYNAA